MSATIHGCFLAWGPPLAIRVPLMPSSVVRLHTALSRKIICVHARWQRNPRKAVIARSRSYRFDIRLGANTKNPNSGIRYTEIGVGRGPPGCAIVADSGTVKRRDR